MRNWFRHGDPWIWMNAAAVALSIIMVAGVLGLIAVRGMSHFWPKQIEEIRYLDRSGQAQMIMGEVFDREKVPASILRESGDNIPESVTGDLARYLLKVGNRDQTGKDFYWVVDFSVEDRNYPEAAIVLERHEWGNFYGYLHQILENGVEQSYENAEALHADMYLRLKYTEDLFNQVHYIERNAIGDVNYAFERLRLKERGLELKNKLDDKSIQSLAEERAKLSAEYKQLEQERAELIQKMGRDQFVMKMSNGGMATLPASSIVRAYQPNSMSLMDKIFHYGLKLWEFVADNPREANTEGGVFPAIFGTVIMVMIMAVLVTPLGVIAAVYLREYAKQGPVVRMIRIAVNNLAGVPSIVYGVFGLGFFVYAIGGTLDQLFFPEALPSPTFGTGGLLWASLTLALLTLPVVIVSTEEGLSRIPKAIREGSLALGATKAETLWRTVLPMASPAMMTGVILAVARAAGEVAPLMLVGVVKLAPSLPLDGNYPYLHADRKFMHLGFHIYDVGFQSPNVEAARPLVYATAFLLVVVIILLNLLAIRIRNSLREKYRSLDQH